MQATYIREGGLFDLEESFPVNGVKALVAR
jgi:hypothetical protein